MYGEDLAFVHEAGFTQLAEAAARMVLDLRPPPRRGERGPARPVVVDLGCGGGILAEALTDAGYAVQGFDVSPAMVALARERVPGARFQVADAATLVIPAADIVTAVGEVFCYACQAPGSLGQLLGRIRSALHADGLLLFDVATTGRAVEATRAEREGRGWRMTATASEAEGILTRTIDTWRSVDGGERHDQEVHRLRLFDAAEVMAALTQAGFDAEHLGGYDDFGFQPGWDGFLARPSAD